MRVLVTGGLGYLGCVLVPKLLKHGHHVRIVDIIPPPVGVAELGGGLELRKVDIRDGSKMLECLNDVEAVVNLAAIVGEPLCRKHPDLAKEVNEKAVYFIVDKCKEKGVKRFIHLSTCSVYGSSESMADEDSPAIPTSLYQETKVNSETYVLKSNTDVFHPTVLRMATLFGLSPRLKNDTLVHQFVWDAITKKKIDVYGGNLWRPLVHVSDAADAILFCLEFDEAKLCSRIFNVGDDGLNFTKMDIAKTVTSYLPETSITSVDVKDPRNYKVSFKKIKSTLGFNVSRSLDDGILEVKKQWSDLKCHK